jgi:hypothetical protein
MINYTWTILELFAEQDKLVAIRYLLSGTDGTNTVQSEGQHNFKDGTANKALEQIVVNGAGSAVDQVYDLKSYMKIFSKMNIEIMSQIGAEFVKILRNIIIRFDVLLLRNKINRTFIGNLKTSTQKIRASFFFAALILFDLINSRY